MVHWNKIELTIQTNDVSVILGIRQYVTSYQVFRTKVRMRSKFSYSNTVDTPLVTQFLPITKSIQYTVDQIVILRNYN